jgi:4-alpha-glucanotransferase
MKLFAKAKEVIGELPVMAEDLGVITAEVNRMRDHFGFPGMRVLQFAFGLRDGKLAAEDPFLPHNHLPNSVVYTGTHDNDTTLGWYRVQPPEVKDIVRRYLARDDHDIVWDFIRMALSSVGRYAIVPMQDILSLGTDARMNLPSTVGGNWTWRFLTDEVDEIVKGRLSEMTELYDRAPHEHPPDSVPGAPSGGPR